MICLRAISVALATWACAGLATAQSSTTVDVRGQATVPAASLRSACPQALTELPDALAATARETARAGEVSVRVELEGGRLHDLRTQGGHARQALAVRRAVRLLGCDNGDAGRQRLHFRVRFLDPFAPSASGRTALLDLHEPAPRP